MYPTYIAAKTTAREMWVGQEKLYQGSSEQRKMYLEEKMRNIRMKKGERFESLSRIQENRDQLSAVGSIPRDSELVRLTLNSVSEDYKVFVQSSRQRKTFRMGSDVGNITARRVEERPPQNPLGGWQ